MSRNERSPRVIWAICLTTVLCGVLKVEPLQAGETLAEQRARIERMDPARKAELRRAQEQFAALGSAERQRLHDLHDQIEAHPRSDELLAVMERYCEWVVNTLTPSERADLRELPPDKRIERIKELREEQSRRRQSGPGGGPRFCLGRAAEEAVAGGTGSTDALARRAHGA